MLATGGTRDHAHVLFALPADTSAARAVQRIKANSSRWMGQQGIRFAWQEGYAAFSVSASEHEAVKRYIANQAEHHRKQTFEEELVAMLKRAGVENDPEKIFG